MRMMNSLGAKIGACHDKPVTKRWTEKAKRAQKAKEKREWKRDN